MIEDMQNKFTELGKQIALVDKAYIKYKTKDYVTFQVRAMSLMRRIRPDMLAIIAILLAASAFAGLWIRFRYLGGGEKN